MLELFFFIDLIHLSFHSLDGSTRFFKRGGGIFVIARHRFDFRQRTIFSGSTRRGAKVNDHSARSRHDNRTSFQSKNHCTYTARFLCIEISAIRNGDVTSPLSLSSPRSVLLFQLFIIWLVFSIRVFFYISNWNDIQHIENNLTLTNNTFFSFSFRNDFDNIADVRRIGHSSSEPTQSCEIRTMYEWNLRAFRLNR